MLRVGERDRDRIRSAVAVIAIHALLGWALLRGLGVELTQPADRHLKLIDLLQEPPPPPAVPAEPDTAEAAVAKPAESEGAAAPANLADRPTEVLAPPPEIRLPVPPPIIVAPIAAEGLAPVAGAAELPGPGTGSGGVGSGLGSGERGSGTGGGGGGRGTRARLISGSIGPDDYPRAALAARAQGTVFIRFTVAPHGRVSDCAVTRSSGNRALDEATCRLIRRRFRYRPARDAAGRPVAEVVRGEQGWELGPEPPLVEVDPPSHEH